MNLQPLSIDTNTVSLFLSPPQSARLAPARKEGLPSLLFNVNETMLKSLLSSSFVDDYHFTNLNDSELSLKDRFIWIELISDCPAYLRKKWIESDETFGAQGNRLKEYWVTRNNKMEALKACRALKACLPYFGWARPAPPLPYGQIATVLIELFSKNGKAKDIRQTIELLTPTKADIRALVHVLTSDTFIKDSYIYPMDEEINHTSFLVLASVLNRAAPWAEDLIEDRNLAQKMYLRFKIRIEGMLEVLGDLYPDEIGSKAEFAQTHLSAIRTLKNVNLYNAYYLVFKSRNLLSGTHHELPDLCILETYYEDIKGLNEDEQGANLAVQITTRALIDLSKKHTLLPWKYIQGMLDLIASSNYESKEMGPYDGVLAVFLNNVFYIPSDETSGDIGTEKMLYKISKGRLKFICETISDCSKGRLIPRIISQINQLKDPALLVEFSNEAIKCRFQIKESEEIKEAKCSIAIDSLHDAFVEFCEVPSEETLSDYFDKIKSASDSDLIPMTLAKHLLLSSVHRNILPLGHYRIVHGTIKILSESGLRAFIIAASHLMDHIEPIHKYDKNDFSVALTLYALIPYMASIQPAYHTRVEEALKLASIRRRYYRIVHQSVATMMHQIKIVHAGDHSRQIIVSIIALLDGCTRTVDLHLQKSLIQYLKKVHPKAMNAPEIKKWMVHIQARLGLLEALSSFKKEGFNTEQDNLAFQELEKIEIPKDKLMRPSPRQHIISLIARNFILHALEDPAFSEDDLARLIPHTDLVIGRNFSISRACFDELAEFFSEDYQNIKKINQEDERHEIFIPRLRALIRGANNIKDLPSRFLPLIKGVESFEHDRAHADRNTRRKGGHS